MPREALSLNHPRLSTGSGSQAPRKYQRPSAHASTHAWGVHLSGRDTHGAQCCHQEGALLATPAVGGAHSGEWTAGAGVAGPVGHPFVAPVVHLEYGFAHRETLQPLSELLEKHFAAVVEVLVVHPHGKDEMPELPVGDVASPWHLLAGFQRQFHVAPEEGGVVVASVGQGHVAVEKCQQAVGFCCRGGCRQGEWQEQQCREQQDVKDIGVWLIHLFYPSGITEGKNTDFF